jgi:hypothetical protein
LLVAREKSRLCCVVIFNPGDGSDEAQNSAALSRTSSAGSLISSGSVAG